MEHCWKAKDSLDWKHDERNGMELVESSSVSTKLFMKARET